MNSKAAIGPALVALSLLSGSAIAKQGGVCYSQGFHPEAKLKCDHIGSVTMKEIYAKGWRVVAVWTVSGNMTITYVAIEEQ